RQNWQGRKTDTALRMHIGPVASGASVLEDEKIAESIVLQHRKLIGIEMEGYAVLAVAEEAPLPQPKAFVIKSVCDFADTEKNDDCREYAAYTRAAALRLFV